MCGAGLVEQCEIGGCLTRRWLSANGRRPPGSIARIYDEESRGTNRNSSDNSTLIHTCMMQETGALLCTVGNSMKRKGGAGHDNVCQCCTSSRIDPSVLPRSTIWQ